MTSERVYGFFYQVYLRCLVKFCVDEIKCTPAKMSHFKSRPKITTGIGRSAFIFIPQNTNNN